MKLKCPILLKPLATIVQENSKFFYPSEPFRIIHFTMRHPVMTFSLKKVDDLREQEQEEKGTTNSEPYSLNGQDSSNRWHFDDPILGFRI